MSEPPTHYQVSFTARQALSLFIGLLAVLGLSYFFGLMTGLSGREAPAEAAGAPPAAENASAESGPPPSTPPPVAENMAFPIPVTGVRSAGGPRPGPATTIHTFEDGDASASASAPARAATARPAAPAGGFRIQVLSVSSRADAETEAARLTRRGLPARVEPGNGPRGTVYRVRVGPYATREEAEQAGRRLSSQGRRDTWIVPPGQ